MNNRSAFETNLDKNAANFAALTPIKFLERAAQVYPNRPAVVHGEIRRNWSETFSRCKKLASALNAHGVEKGDAVSIMAPNLPEHFEAHFAVPMCGAVLNSINTRLDSEVVAFILKHAGSKVLITDKELSTVVKGALELMDEKPYVIDIDDPYWTDGELIGDTDYEAFIANGDEDYAYALPADEWEAITLNYTSGTTGDPKGVVYHHRGAYLNANSNALSWAMDHHPVYLWTLPMFHCNGWCFPWTLSAIAGTHVCLRQVRAEPIWNALADEGVTHLCGAPIVMSLLISAPAEAKRDLAQPVQFFTAAAPPPESLLADMKAAGFEVTHLYGLTETYGPAVINDWHGSWSDLPSAEQAALKARQGVRYLPLEQLDVLNPDTMQPVPRDGQTMGEVMFRGNVVMKGYFRNSKATGEAFAGGWFHSGDLGVMHPDGYIQLKDRSKDIIISGGENISSIEVEEALYCHPAVAVAAVVAMPHEKWGETPCAFVELTNGQEADAENLRSWCRSRLAPYKVPGRFVFAAIPRTSTGKIQKFALREQAREIAS